jgi:Fe-S-cluster containining protein
MLDLAVSMDCSKCATHCCGMLPNCRPVLMPWEQPAQVFGLVVKKRKLQVVKQRTGGFCIFLDYECRCSIYERRPLECRLYPFLLEFKRHIVGLKVDPRCQHHEMFSNASAKRLLEGMAGYKFPLKWIWDYCAYKEERDQCR